jgi:hypothetical protein
MSMISWWVGVSAINRVAIPDFPAGTMDDHLTAPRYPTKPFLCIGFRIPLGGVERARLAFSLAQVLPKAIGAFRDVTSFRHQILLSNIRT